jgi:imidazolonepropionase-like amidohydrolase
MFSVASPRGAFGRPGELTEAEVTLEVQRQATAGVEFVKVYFNMPPSLVKAAIDEAHAHDLKVIGHLGLTSWQQAAEFGIDALTHVGVFGGASWELSSEDVEPVTDFNDIIALLPTIDFSGPKAVALAQTLRENDVAVDPTLVISETNTWGDDPTIVERYGPDIGPSWLTEGWGSSPHPRAQFFSAEAFEQLKAAFTGTLAFVRLLHESGVTLLAGTDTTAPWVAPGTSYHRELELLNQAGIPPRDVLRIASYNAALSLDQLENFGTLEAGKIADIVVLNADPLANIGNTREIDIVIKAGQIIDPRALLATPDPEFTPPRARRGPPPAIFVLLGVVVFGAIYFLRRRRRPKSTT